MCEPLRGKRYQQSDEIEIKYVKSAVEGLIKYHEERIEIAIETIEGEPYHPTMRGVLDFINHEYNALMQIEHWMEDVL